MYNYQEKKVSRESIWLVCGKEPYTNFEKSLSQIGVDFVRDSEAELLNNVKFSGKSVNYLEFYNFHFNATESGFLDDRAGMIAKIGDEVVFKRIMFFFLVRQIALYVERKTDSIQA